MSRLLGFVGRRTSDVNDTFQSMNDSCSSILSEPSSPIATNNGVVADESPARKKRMGFLSSMRPLSPSRAKGKLKVDVGAPVPPSSLIDNMIEDQTSEQGSQFPRSPKPRSEASGWTVGISESDDSDEEGGYLGGPRQPAFLTSPVRPSFESDRSSSEVVAANSLPIKSPRKSLVASIKEVKSPMRVTKEEFQMILAERAAKEKREQETEARIRSRSKSRDRRPRSRSRDVRKDGAPKTPQQRDRLVVLTGGDDDDANEAAAGAISQDMATPVTGSSPSRKLRSNKSPRKTLTNLHDLPLSEGASASPRKCRSVMSSYEYSTRSRPEASTVVASSRRPASSSTITSPRRSCQTVVSPSKLSPRTRTESSGAVSSDDTTVITSPSRCKSDQSPMQAPRTPRSRSPKRPNSPRRETSPRRPRIGSGVLSPRGTAQLSPGTTGDSAERKKDRVPSSPRDESSKEVIEQSRLSPKTSPQTPNGRSRSEKDKDQSHSSISRTPRSGRRLTAQRTLSGELETLKSSRVQIGGSLASSASTVADAQSPGRTRASPRPKSSVAKPLTANELWEELGYKERPGAPNRVHSSGSRKEAPSPSKSLENLFASPSGNPRRTGKRGSSKSVASVAAQLQIPSMDPTNGSRMGVKYTDVASFSRS
jgi:hypothetical protein